MLTRLDIKPIAWPVIKKRKRKKRRLSATAQRALYNSPRVFHLNICFFGFCYSTFKNSYGHSSLLCECYTRFVNTNNFKECGQAVRQIATITRRPPVTFLGFYCLQEASDGMAGTSTNRPASLLVHLLAILPPQEPSKNTEPAHRRGVVKIPKNIVFFSHYIYY